MTTENNLHIQKDLAAKKVIITRYFNAPLERVWNAWTQSDLLDQWWAPKPYKAETKTMNFTVGGYWLYAMVGPDDSRMWNKIEYKAIEPHKSFQSTDLFCDESGNKNNDFPSMNWNIEFQNSGTATKVIVEITFTSEADLQKIMEMGFEAGFAAGLGNLDELLAN